MTCVDISQPAIDMAKANAVRNGLDGKMDFLCSVLFDLLTKLADRKCRDYDFIILDPAALPNPPKRCKTPPAAIKRLT